MIIPDPDPGKTFRIRLIQIPNPELWNILSNSFWYGWNKRKSQNSFRFLLVVKGLTRYNLFGQAGHQPDFWRLDIQQTQYWAQFYQSINEQNNPTSSPSGARFLFCSPKPVVQSRLTSQQHIPYGTIIQTFYGLFHLINTLIKQLTNQIQFCPRRMHEMVDGLLKNQYPAIENRFKEYFDCFCHCDFLSV